MLRCHAAGCPGGTKPQLRGSYAHALFSAGAAHGICSTEWKTARARKWARVKCHNQWQNLSVAEDVRSSADAITRDALRFCSGEDGGPKGFHLMGGEFKVPGLTADLDAEGEYHGNMPYGPGPFWCPVEFKTMEGPYTADFV
jgi:hypothetical protein